MELTMEQEFALLRLNADADRLNPEQAKEMVKELMRQSMIKDNFVKSMIKDQMEGSLPRLKKIY